MTADIRALVVALKDHASAEPEKYDQERISRWSQWACGVASGLDPFENGFFEGLAAQGSKPSTQD